MSLTFAGYILAMLGVGARLNLEKNFKGGTAPPPNAGKAMGLLLALTYAS